MLLEDVFIIENLQVINEGNTGPMRVRGVFQRADEENNNGRIYPKALLEREITKLSESMKGRRLMGELDHPQHDSVKLSNVSHLITKLEAKGNEIIGEAEILDTPMGKVAKALIEGGVQVGISSRGMGTLSEGQDGKRYVNEDFRLITWDLVADPSTRGAFPALSESTNLNSMLVEEILNDVLPKVTKEKVFSTLLEETLNEAKRKKAKKKPAKKTKGGLPDFSRDGKITKADVLMGRGVIPKPGQKMKTKKVAREDSSTLFAHVGAILGESDSAKALKAQKDFEVETANMSPDKRNRRKRGVFEGTVLFPHFGAALMEGGYLNEEFLNEGVGETLARVGKGVAGAVGKAASAVRKSITNKSGMINRAGRAIGRGAAATGSAIKSGAGRVARRADATFGRVKDSAKREGGLVKKALSSAKRGVKGAASGAKELAGKAIDAVPKTAGYIAGGIAAATKGGADAAKKAKAAKDAKKGPTGGQGRGGSAGASAYSSLTRTPKTGSSDSKTDTPKTKPTVINRGKSGQGGTPPGNTKNDTNRTDATRAAQAGPDDTGRPRRQIAAGRVYARIGDLLETSAPEKAKRVMNLSAKSQAELHRRKMEREGKDVYGRSKDKKKS